MEFDLTFLDGLLDQVAVLKEIPPEVRPMVYAAILTQMMVGVLRLAITGKKVRKEAIDGAELHWFNRFLSRFGPLFNFAVGGLLSTVTTIPMAMGLLGGGFSSWTFAVLHKTGIPTLQQISTIGKQKE